jgi:hypothetical protein
MGLLDNFMPGETHGMPTTGGGLLDDPLLQIGLGILANNNSKNAGQVLGRGALQGMQNYQQQQGLAQQRRFQDMQAKRYEQQGRQFDAEEASHAEFDTKFPQYKGLSRLDPKAAIKIANPGFANNSADPYYTPISTAAGLGSFDNRSGQFVLVQDANGKPVIKAADSPQLQGAIEEAKSKADGNYKIDTSIPGTVQTVTQTALQANPSLANPIPQTAPSGQPSFTVSPQVQAGRDDKRLQILLAEQQAEGGPGKNQELDKEIARFGPRAGGGIAVPTPAQQAANKKVAELDAESEFTANKDMPRVLANAETALMQIDQLVGSKDGKVKPHAGFNTAVGASSKYDPRNYLPGTDAAGFKSRLEQLQGGAFLQAFSDLRGAGAITEQEGLKATNAIQRMNVATSEKEFVTAARDYQDAIRGSVNRAKLRAGKGQGEIMPSSEAMPSTPRRRVFNPKTGKIE